MMRCILLGLAALAPLTATAADDIDRIDLLNQSEFRRLAEDLGSALSYKALSPAAPLGVTGFDVGIEVTATRLEHADLLDRATSGAAPSTVYVPKLHVHKGLPLGLDVGAFYGAVPDTNVKLAGAELRYALIAGGATTPALALRGTYTQLSGVDQLALDTTGLELTASKGFAVVTPYAGIGRVWVDAGPRNAGGLSAEDFGLAKYYVGANFNFALLNVALEADRTGDATTYGAKLGWRF
jgi:hypothetical protein